MTNTIIHRITIIGNGASGKTTLSRTLANIVQLPTIHLDKYYWKDWQPIDPSNWKIIHNELISKNFWIIEGTQPRELANRLARSDLVIFLDPPTHVCIYRFIKKYLVSWLKKQPHENNDGFCYKKFDLKSLFWIFNFHKNIRGKIIIALANSNKPVVTIKNNRELAAYLQKMSNRLLA